jgi:16S rRNA (adenine1518-N6/adenine1519-N6)-dimethyltransferase
MKIAPETLFDGPYAIVANLPYNVGTALFTGWLSGQAWPPQLEIADADVPARSGRNALSPRRDHDAYGRLAVLAQWRSTARSR